MTSPKTTWAESFDKRFTERYQGIFEVEVSPDGTQHIRSGEILRVMTDDLKSFIADLIKKERAEAILDFAKDCAGNIPYAMTANKTRYVGSLAHVVMKQALERRGLKDEFIEKLTRPDFLEAQEK